MTRRYRLQDDRHVGVRVPPRPAMRRSWTREERVEALERIAAKADLSPVDEIEAAAHMAALAEPVPQQAEECSWCEQHGVCDPANCPSREQQAEDVPS